MSNTMSDTGANDGQQVTSIEDVFDAGREYQRRIDADKTEWQSGQEVGNLRWAIGYRTNRLGDYLLKLGDRICGDKPQGVAELMDMAEQMGRRQAVGGVNNIVAAGVVDIYAKLDKGRREQLLNLALELCVEQRSA